MKRFFTILEGEAKGQTKPVASPLMIVGRSKDADLYIEDSLISKRHLEIRLDGETVFIEDKSSHNGSLLNGKRLSGIVSLNAGDIIEIGHTKLRYEEAPVDGPVSDAQPSVEAESSELSGTRAAGTDDRKWEQEARDEAEPDATHAVAADGTVMMDPSKLPGWKAPPNEAAPTVKGVWLGLVFLLVLGVVAAVWFLRQKQQVSEAGTSEFKDPLFAFSLEYPSDWARSSEPPDGIVFAFGNKEDNQWARVNVFMEKQTQHTLTGLQDGFDHFQDVLKKRFPSFELHKSATWELNNAAGIFFGFSTPTLQGRGFYLLNADTRIVLLGFSPRTCFDRFKGNFDGVFNSFRLSAGESQQFIDFPLPDDAVRQLALANPAELSRRADERLRLGDALLKNRGVAPENLYRSVQAYREALQMIVAAPQRLPTYEVAARSLLQASKVYKDALNRQRFEFTRAESRKDWEAAYAAAQKLMLMVPEKTDADYQKAYQDIRRLQPRR